MEKNLPERKKYWGEFLKAKDKMGIIAREKRMKSFLALQLGISISNGAEFLGYRTEQGNVLYINFEISEEKLKERLEDILVESKLSIENFYTMSIAGGLELNTDVGRGKLRWCLDEHEAQGRKFEILIIDPRRQSMNGDENQSQILDDWSKAVDSLQDQYGFSFVVVHHEGKNTTGAGRGSSVFDGWLTTILTMKDGFTIRGRDFEATKIPAQFEYPLWQVSHEELENRKSAVTVAKNVIEVFLKKNNGTLQADLKKEIFRQRVSQYAYQEAIRELQEEKKIILDKPPKNIPGHHKLVCLVDQNFNQSTV